MMEGVVRAWTVTAGDLGAWVGAAAGAYGVGSGVLEMLRLRPLPGSERAAWSLALGFPPLILAMVAAGAAGAWIPAVAWGIWAAGLASAWGSRARLREDAGALRRELAALAQDPWTRAALAVIAVRLVFMVLEAQLPAAAHSADALKHHLAVPRQWIRAGGLVYLPSTLLATTPSYQDLVYVWALLLRSDVLANLLSVLAVLIFVLAFLAAGRRQEAPRAGAIAAALWISLSMVKVQGPIPYVDIPVALYTFLGLSGLFLWRASGSFGWLAAAGTATGWAAGMKYTGSVGTVLLLVALAWLVRRQAAGIRWRALAAFLVPAVALPMVWYARQWWLTGNPVYPMFYPLLGGRDLNDAVWMRYWIGLKGEALRGRSWSDLAALPWRLLAGNRFEGYAGHFALAAYGGLLWGAWKGWAGGWAPGLLAFAAGWTAAWFRLSQILRYWLPAAACLALAAGLAAEGALTRRRRGELAALALLFLPALLYRLPGLQAGDYRGAGVALGWESREAYLRKAFPLAETLREVSRRLPPRSKVFLFGESRSYYLDAEVVWGDPGMQGVVAYDAMTGWEDLAVRLRELEVTHLLAGSELPPDLVASGYYPPGVFEWVEALLQRAPLIYEGGGLRVVEVSARVPLDLPGPSP